MALPAFAAYERGIASKGFEEAIGKPVAVSTAPMQALSSKDPGPMQKLAHEVRGAKAQVSKTLGGAIDAHKKAVKLHGLADAQNGQVARLFNPAKDGMMIAASCAVPAFAVAASAITLANVVSYFQADRKSKKKDLHWLEDAFRSHASVSRGMDDVQWDKPGFHKLDAANDEPELSEDEILYLSQDIHQQRFVQILMGQEAQIEVVEAANKSREIKGLPHSVSTIEHAQQSDSVWLRRNLDAPVPGDV